MATSAFCSRVMNAIVEYPSWTVGPVTPSLNKEVIHVWRVLLPVSEETKRRFLQTLSKVECQRMSQFYFNKDKERYLIARGALREIIARYFSVLPTDIELHTTEYGKPYIKYPNFHFNLSHSENMVLYAFSQSPIGIDVEYIKEERDLLAVAAQFCSINEYSTLLALSEQARRTFFYKLWTSKEALVKAMGYGLSFPLQEIEVSLLPCNEVRCRNILWKLEEINLENDYMAVFATEQKNAKSYFYSL